MKRLIDTNLNWILFDSIQLDTAASETHSFRLGAIMNFNRTNYGAARGVLGFSEFILWCGVGWGIIVAILAGGAASRGYGSSGLLAAVPGISISIFCFVGVVLVQMGKASVDTADYSYQMLSVARDQLAVSKQGLSTASAPTTYADQAVNSVERQAAQPVPVPTPVPAKDPELNKDNWDYRGMRINRSDLGFLVDGKNFDSLELAKLYVDGEALRLRMNGPSGGSL
ncbi:hypothetical protein [Gymnodinialimonas ceratoperidinii]|uniref:Uncharacterized protein n=1 Tax=Gymnodinialimonas ceratoperidinii TaxID=2856823 RepID=A0A8F6U062_9RHOB|nr:hypothetical protein [Gymnodinialimonas ceratoperidinii]QXT41148.1 hypothetical protein KYE46_08055 [Gymnodinialimonas ceratoperidinii]